MIGSTKRMGGGGGGEVERERERGGRWRERESINHTQLSRYGKKQERGACVFVAQPVSRLSLSAGINKSFTSL